MEILFIPIAFLLDQWTKDKAEANYVGKKEQICQDKITLGLVYNKGAVFGFLKNNQALLWVLSTLSLLILMVIGIPLMFLKGAHMMKLGVCFMFGGALGNLYDRYKKEHVVDFFSFWFKKDVFFNIADMFVIVGVIIYTIGSLFKK
ncbi:MAG: signal peptidase II [Vallitaleaceae bacterium]|jgi:signal peptidase II|nr:signal peptidase II [Vallitaleaceae bacterium]